MTCSACISSGARLVFSIMNMYSDDVTYSYSLVGLCTFAEVTCGFIVFSVTAIPRSFASFKRSKLVLRLKLQYSSITEVSNGLQPHQARWQNTKPISSESDASTEIDAHTC